MEKRWKLGLVMSLAVSVVGCDHATKHWAESSLQRGGELPLVSGVLDLNYVRNFDIAFNALRFLEPATRSPLILVSGLLSSLLILGWWWRRRRQATAVEQLGFALVLSGAVGNQLDRWLRGYVVDFIHLHHWPVFNVADMAIVAGMLLVVLAQYQPGRRKTAHAGDETPGGVG